MKRIFNFSAGPAILPLQALEKAASELVNFNNSGMSIMEVSHRTPLYENVHNETLQLIREILSVPAEYDILLLQGGASSQFFMVPMNLIKDNMIADYVISGSWSEKAIKEAKILGKKVNIAATSKETNFDRVPSTFNFTKDACYVHITSNETIQGVQYKKFPDTNGVPIIIDASSDIFSYEIDWKNIGLIYAGAQKNAGPAGVTIVIIRKDLYERESDNIPTMLRYSTHAKENSLYNTPPVFSIYMVNLTLKWLKSIGGIPGIKKINEEKAKLIYDVIDQSNGFYKGHAVKENRSTMNVTFTLKNPELESKFIKESEAKNMVGLKGHRSVGGMRASIYNAMPIEGCKLLADFMRDFIKNNA
ncbi:MAG TPA: 3-phosphoserine/phosphohydroxythreonine transaminase [Spirochaetota bacterium]|nr:3-phosphoserine/phosphohydroxythreonine transaminase [Spirochaetota bacterium]HOL57091.1 3-phosphoserine/phosphohydroxythreonine transaminase [Spirochaetota bacterium]HPP04677.1 3-phosphoserine/phosphohydroxythreonine transaminase [Spirochaetota bacterium]